MCPHDVSEYFPLHDAMRSATDNVPIIARGLTGEGKESDKREGFHFAARTSVFRCELAVEPSQNPRAIIAAPMSA